MLRRMFNIILCIILALTLCSCASDDGIATINGESVDEACFNFYFTELKNAMQNQHGENAWQDATLDGKPALEYVRERALQSAVEDKIIMIKAKEDGILLTEEDKKSIDYTKQQWINQYGSENAFLEAIKTNYGLTGEQFDYMLEAVYYRIRVIDKYVSLDESDVKEYYGKNIAKVKHILIATVDLSTGMPLTEEEVNKAKQKVQEIQSKIEDEVDFDTLVAEYTQDQDVYYYVGKGYALASDGSQSGGMVPEFETASFELDVDEISAPVESAYGYHIIKRYENDAEMYEISKGTLSDIIKSTKFVGIIDGWKKSMDIVLNEEMYNSYK